MFVINVYPATATYNMNVTLYSILNFITITILVKYSMRLATLGYTVHNHQYVYVPVSVSVCRDPPAPDGDMIMKQTKNLAWAC